MSDNDLRILFAQQRHADLRGAPLFEHLQTRARAAVPAPRRLWLVTLLASPLVVLIGLAFVQPPSPPSLTQALPVLLDSQPRGAPLFAELSASATPSDFLMPRHSTFKVL